MQARPSAGPNRLSHGFVPRRPAPRAKTHASAGAAVRAGGGVVAVSVVTATGAKSVLLSIKLVV